MAEYKKMKRLTVSIPKKLKDEMDALPHVNWPMFLKDAIRKDVEKIEQLQKEGRL